MRGALYVRLKPGEMADLVQMAADERRDLHDQAAYLISEGMARWRARRQFVAGLASEADIPEAGVA